MKIHGNDIIIHRGETFTLSMNVKMRNGDPFIMAYDIDNRDAHNPYVLITIASSRYQQTGSYIKNWWLSMHNTPSFTDTEIKTITDLNQGHSDTQIAHYLYYCLADGKYYYVSDDEFVEYTFIINKSFTYDDTIKLVSQTYFYSVTYYDGPLAPCKELAEEYVRSIWDKIKTNGNLDYDYDYAVMNGTFTEDFEAHATDEQKETYKSLYADISKDDLNYEPIVKPTQVTPIVSPSKLTVLSNLRGGL